MSNLTGCLKSLKIPIFLHLLYKVLTLTQNVIVIFTKNDNQLNILKKKHTHVHF